MKRLLLVLSVMALLMLVVAAPAVAQDAKIQQEEAKAKTAEEKVQQEETKAQKAEEEVQKEEAKEQVPSTGGIPINASLLGLAAGALVVSGGLLLVRRVTR